MSGTRRSLQRASSSVLYQKQRAQIFKKQSPSSSTGIIHNSSSETSHPLVFEAKAWEFFLPPQEARCQRLFGSRPWSFEFLNALVLDYVFDVYTVFCYITFFIHFYVHFLRRRCSLAYDAFYFLQLSFRQSSLLDRSIFLHVPLFTMTYDLGGVWPSKASLLL